MSPLRVQKNLLIAIATLLVAGTIDPAHAHPHRERKDPGCAVRERPAERHDDDDDDDDDGARRMRQGRRIRPVERARPSRASKRTASRPVSVDRSSGRGWKVHSGEPGEVGAVVAHEHPHGDDHDHASEADHEHEARP